MQVSVYCTILKHTCMLILIGKSIEMLHWGTINLKIHYKENVYNYNYRYIPQMWIDPYPIYSVISVQ